MTDNEGGATVDDDTSEPAVMSVVQLGRDGFLLAKLNEDLPEGDYNITLNVVPADAVEAQDFCLIKFNCCRSLHIPVHI